MHVWVGRRAKALSLVSELPGMLAKVILSLARMSTESTAVGLFPVLSSHSTVSWYVGVVVKSNTADGLLV